MIKLKILFFKILFYFLSITIAFAQSTDSTVNEEEYEDSIVYVKKNPLVIKKEFYLADSIPKIVKIQKSSFAIEESAMALGYGGYYKYCASCSTYYHALRVATKPLLSWRFGFDVHYRREKLLASLGIAYSIYREQFSTGATGISVNQYRYVSFPVGLGWYLFDANNISLVVKANYTHSLLSGVSGATYVSNSDSTTTSLESQNLFRKHTNAIGGSIGLQMKLLPKLYLNFEIFYNGDLNSITNSNALYVQQRNMLGLKTGIIRGF